MKHNTAKFTPTHGLFTKTVNAGDTGVVINMTVVGSPSDTSTIRWRKDGGEEITSQNGLDHYSFQGPIQPSDGGFYEIYNEGERSTGRGSILRLFVRGNSPAYYYSYSSLLSFYDPHAVL